MTKESWRKKSRLGGSKQRSSPTSDDMRGCPARDCDASGCMSGLIPSRPRVLASKNHQNEEERISLLQKVEQVKRGAIILRLLFGRHQCLQSSLFPGFGPFLTAGIVHHFAVIWPRNPRGVNRGS